MKRLVTLLALGAVFGGIALHLIGDRDAAAPSVPQTVDLERPVESASQA